jgi:hypothetical protein
MRCLTKMTLERGGNFAADLRTMSFRLFDRERFLTYTVVELHEKHFLVSDRLHEITVGAVDRQLYSVATTLFQITVAAHCPNFSNRRAVAV